MATSPSAWVVALQDENDLLRSRVAELEEALEEAHNAIKALSQQTDQKTDAKAAGPAITLPSNPAVPATAYPAAATAAGNDAKEPPEVWGPVPMPEWDTAISPSARPKSRAPNANLSKAMAGRAADWDIIQGMAKNIWHPEYTLRRFYDDCTKAFPELELFFFASNGGPDLPADIRQAAVAAEIEYQRTIGALFTVFWLLRLDIDGALSFCYGVDEDWRPRQPAENVEPSPASPVGQSGVNFSKRTSDQKRAAFLADMDWSLFRDLVTRAGCAADSPRSEERVVALLCLTAFHDIMKLNKFQPAVHPDHAPYKGYEAGVRINDHDVALAYVMEYFPHVLPSYYGLDPDQRSSVLFTHSEMGFNHGWFVQAEAPPGGMLTNFKQALQAGAPQADIDLYFLHWITDLAGAQATPLAGAEKLVLAFPQHVLKNFLWSMPYLSNLAHMQETQLVEEYLEARWKTLLFSEALPDDFTAVALSRLVLMAQADDARDVVQAFRDLPAADQLCLTTELSRSGSEGQSFRKNVVSGGPALLLYYAPGFLQKNNKCQARLGQALRCLCVVFRGSRALWPANSKHQGSTVIIQVGELKQHTSDVLTSDTGPCQRTVWVVLHENKVEGCVTLCTAKELNALCFEGSKFRALDFKIEQPSSNQSPDKELPVMPRAGDFDLLVFSRAPRILVFTDMSTECDDECALLWLLAALNRRGGYSTVELVHVDTLARVQWMAYIFKSKFDSGEWQLRDGGQSFLAGNVLVNLYLAKSAAKEDQVIRDLEAKGPPKMRLAIKEQSGKKVCVPLPGLALSVKDVTEVPSVPLASMVIAAAIPDVDPNFFKRFTSCKCIYVVGTPGGVNCPMSTWPSLLAAMHVLAPLVYLTPQLTRKVRFPRSYVMANKDWPTTIKYTVWQACVTFMTRRPELPPNVGNWGFILRLNIANATFCRDWHFDVTNKHVSDVDPSQHEDVVELAWLYVDRMSGDNRAVGVVVQELRLVGVHLDLGPGQATEEGQPVTDAALETIRKAYREALFESVYTCLLTSKALLWTHEQNTMIGVDEGGFEKVQRRCGYVNPVEDLSRIYGESDAITLLQGLPLRWLTPAYDVVGMICADASLEEDSDLDGGLGLQLEMADHSNYRGLLTEEQIQASDYPVLQTVPQHYQGIYAVGPFS